MKYVLILVLFLTNLKGFTQDFKNQSDFISYNLYFHYNSEGQIKKVTDYFIVCNSYDTSVIYKPDSLGICILPKDTGFSFFLNSNLIFTQLIIDKNKETVTDTMIVPQIYKAPIGGFYIGPTYYLYYISGEKCNGFQKTYWKDGQLMQKGYFKEGRLKYMKTFYPNGITADIIRERLIHGCDIMYDESGKLILKYNYFLVFSRYKVLDKENGKYLRGHQHGKYK